jgi:hypothetical protein
MTVRQHVPFPFRTAAIIGGATPGRLAIVPRPRGGDWLADEVARLKAAGVDILVSMLEPAEAWVRIAAARGLPVPDTGEQRRWVEASVPRRNT